MQVKSLMKEIKHLPLAKRFFILEQTLKSIKEEELKQRDNLLEEADGSISYSASEKSLSKDWLSKEDSRWDELL